VGQSVYAIGNPAGLYQTLTTGVVSGLNRTIPSAVGTRIFGAIQVWELAEFILLHLNWTQIGQYGCTSSVTDLELLSDPSTA
jgi:hypothetical protein